MILALAPRPEPTGGAPLARRGQRRGIAAAEFAVLAPFLAALVIGMVEMGRLVMVKETLTNAARKGCRTGVTPGKGYNDILNNVNNILTDNNIDPSKATITVQIAPYTGTATAPSWGSFTTVTSPSAFNPNPLDKVSVQVSIGVTNVLWLTPVFTSSASVESEMLTMLRQG
jgi:Flp pilus assembly protein TadG